MPKANNNKDLALAIKLSESKYITPPNKFINKSADKRFYYGLIQ